MVSVMISTQMEHVRWTLGAVQGVAGVACRVFCSVSWRGGASGAVKRGFPWVFLVLPSGYVKKAIENGHL